MEKRFIVKLLLLYIFIILSNIDLFAKADHDTIISKISNLNKEKQLEILIQTIEKKIIALDLNNLEYIDKAFAIATEMTNDEKINTIKLYYGEYWKIFGDYKKSAENILSAVSYFESENNYFYMQRSYRILAETYRASTMHHKSLDYLYKAEKICQKINKPIELAYIYNRLAAVYYEYLVAIDIKKSRFFAEKCFELSDSADDFHLYNNNLILIGAIERYYRNYKLSESVLLDVLRLTKKYGDDYNYHGVLINLVKTYYESKELDKAINYANQCIDFTKNKNLENLNLYLYQMLIGIYEDKQQIDSALIFAKNTAGLSINIFTAKRDFILADLTENYEKEKKLFDLERQQTRNYYIILIFTISIILFIIIIILYYTRQKLLKKKNATISEQNHLLSELNATKDKFFSIIAHDLKNPISSFKNITDIMDSDYDVMSEYDKKDFISLLKKSSIHISELLDNLLIWSRSQRGKIDFHSIPVEISIIIDTNINLFELPAAKKNINLISEYSNDSIVNIDINMINTVVRNLLSNAIKFTPENGRIIVKSEENADRVVMSIIDNGIGIETDNIHKLFKIDENITTLGTNQEKGTGLGLIICQEFIEQHNGTIWVESEVGKGSTFKFTLPLYKEK